MTTLRAFLDSRERELTDQMREIRRELTEVRIARAALDPMPDEDAEDGDDKNITIKDMIRAVLRGRQFGASSAEILAAIEHDFGKALERTSLSPQLSRLRGSGIVTLESGRWFLCPEAEPEPISRELLLTPIGQFSKKLDDLVGGESRTEVPF